jgi:hypothetical protein
MANNGKNWSRSQVLALLGVIVAALSLVFAIVNPELREIIGLEKKPVSQPSEVTPPPVPNPTPPIKEVPIEVPVPSIPTQYTIHENQSQFVKDAQTTLSAVFQNQGFVSLTIAPAGKASSVHAVLNGYTEEFTSSTGVFLVQVLNIDYNSKKIVVQVNRKLSTGQQNSTGNIGRTLVEQKCASCHTLEQVYKAKKSRAEWESNVDKMIMYSDRMDFLNLKEKKTVIEFLTDRKTSNLTGN